MRSNLQPVESCFNEGQCRAAQLMVKTQGENGGVSLLSFHVLPHMLIFLTCSLLKQWVAFQELCMKTSMWFQLQIVFLKKIGLKVEKSKLIMSCYRFFFLKKIHIYSPTYLK